MDKLDSFFHNLEDLYNDGKNWILNFTFDDVGRSNVLPVTGVVILLWYFIRIFYAEDVGKTKARLDEKMGIITDSNEGHATETNKDIYESYDVYDTDTSDSYIYDTGTCDHFNIYEDELE